MPGEKHKDPNHEEQAPQHAAGAFEAASKEADIILGAVSRYLCPEGIIIDLENSRPPESLDSATDHDKRRAPVISETEKSRKPSILRRIDNGLIGLGGKIIDTKRQAGAATLSATIGLSSVLTPQIARAAEPEILPATSAAETSPNDEVIPNTGYIGKHRAPEDASSDGLVLSITGPDDSTEQFQEEAIVPSPTIQHEEVNLLPTIQPENDDSSSPPINNEAVPDESGNSLVISFTETSPQSDDNQSNTEAPADSDSVSSVVPDESQPEQPVSQAPATEVDEQEPATPNSSGASDDITQPPSESSDNNQPDNSLAVEIISTPAEPSQQTEEDQAVPPPDPVQDINPQPPEPEPASEPEPEPAPAEDKPEPKVIYTSPPTLPTPEQGVEPIVGATYEVQPDDTLAAIINKFKSVLPEDMNTLGEYMYNPRVLARPEMRQIFERAKERGVENPFDLLVPGDELPIGFGDNYIVQKGDTLGKIARAAGLKLDQILIINPQITNPDKIESGQSIILPVGAVSAMENTAETSEKPDSEPRAASPAPPDSVAPEHENTPAEINETMNLSEIRERLAEKYVPKINQAMENLRYEDSVNNLDNLVKIISQWYAEYAPHDPVRPSDMPDGYVKLPDYVTMPGLEIPFTHSEKQAQVETYASPEMIAVLLAGAELLEQSIEASYPTYQGVILRTRDLNSAHHRTHSDGTNADVSSQWGYDVTEASDGPLMDFIDGDGTNNGYDRQFNIAFATALASFRINGGRVMHRILTSDGELASAVNRKVGFRLMSKAKYHGDHWHLIISSKYILPKFRPVSPFDALGYKGDLGIGSEYVDLPPGLREQEHGAFIRAVKPELISLRRRNHRDAEGARGPESVASNLQAHEAEVYAARSSAELIDLGFVSLAKVPQEDIDKLNEILKEIPTIEEAIQKYNYRQDGNKGPKLPPSVILAMLHDAGGLSGEELIELATTLSGESLGFRPFIIGDDKGERIDGRPTRLADGIMQYFISDPNDGLDAAELDQVEPYLHPAVAVLGAVQLREARGLRPWYFWVNRDEPGSQWPGHEEIVRREAEELDKSIPGLLP